MKSILSILLYRIITLFFMFIFINESLAQSFHIWTHDGNQLSLYRQSSSIVDPLAAWWPFTTTTNASGAYEDSTSNNNDLFAGSGAAQPTWYAASNGIGNNLRFDSGDSATSTISQAFYGMSWWGRSNDQNYAYYSTQGGTQTINGVATTFDPAFWFAETPNDAGQTISDPYSYAVRLRMEATNTFGIKGWTPDTGKYHTNHLACLTGASPTWLLLSDLPRNHTFRLDSTYLTSGGSPQIFSGNEYTNSATGTFSFWFMWENKTGATSNTRVLFDWGSTTAWARYFILQIESGDNLVIDMLGAWKYTLTSTLSTGIWYNVSIVHNGTAPVVYTNNAIASVTTNTSTDLTAWFSKMWGGSNPITFLKIGDYNYASGYKFRGQIDEIRISTNINAQYVSDQYAYTHPTNNIYMNSDHKLTLGNGNVAAFGDPKVWTSYSDPMTNFIGGMTNWGCPLSYSLSIWSQTVLSVDFPFPISSVADWSASGVNTGTVTTVTEGGTWRTDGTNGLFLSPGCGNILFGTTPFDFETNNAFTIALTMARQSSEGALVGKSVGSGTYKGYGVYIDTANQIAFYLNNSFSGNNMIYIYTSGIQAGKFHRIVCTKSPGSAASTAKIYTNGVEASISVYQDTLTGSIKNTERFQIYGRGGVATTFDGYVTHVTVSTNTWTASDVSNDWINIKTRLGR